MPSLADSFLNSFKSREDATQWVVLVVGVVAVFYILMRPRMKRRRDPMERQYRPPAGIAGSGLGLAQQRQIERDMNSLMVQMLDTARQMAAQLDTRAAKLEVLLREAEETIATLRAAVAAGNSAPTFASTASTATAAPHRPPLLEARPPEATGPAPADAAEIAAEPEDASYAPDLTERMPDPRHAEIYAMADQGSSTGEIARQLGRPSGEVELILALRPH